MHYGFANNLAGTENPFPYKRLGGRPAWLPGTFDFIYVGKVSRDAKELVYVNAQTHSHSILTDDIGEVVEANAFQAPEYGFETHIVAVVDYDTVGIYGLDGELALRERLPGGWKPFAVEVIEGDLYKSKINYSIVVISAANERTPDDKSIWLWAPFGDYLKRVDSGKDTGAKARRVDAELWLVPDGAVERIYVRYQEKTRRGSFARSVATGIFFG